MIDHVAGFKQQDKRVEKSTLEILAPFTALFLAQLGLENTPSAVIENFKVDLHAVLLVPVWV